LSPSIGKIYGIPIVLDYSWFLIFALIIFTVGFGLMPSEYPGLGEAVYLSIGVLSSILLFASILIHELAHSIVAARNHVKIKQVRLFLLGGVSEMEEEPLNPSLELKISAAGPLTSVAITAILGALWFISVIARLPAIIQAPLDYATLVNALVAGFNLIPAFPMDGGRIFRSILWMRSKDKLRATRTAARVGRAFAYVLIAIGIFYGFAVNFITGFWLILIGWLITSGAQSGLAQTMVRQDLANLKAGQVMKSRVDSVSQEDTLEELSSEIFRLKHNGFPVLSGSELVGCVTSDDLRKVKKSEWPTTRVGQIMIPREKLLTMKTSEPAVNALNLMSNNRIGRLFVVDDSGKLVGIITRSDIVRTIEFREGTFGSRSGGKSPQELQRTMSVQQGMFFVVEQPASPGADWTALFDREGVALVGERHRISGTQEVKEFTFQALKPGTHPVSLVQRPSLAATGGAQASESAQLEVKYTIVVQ